MGMLKKYKHVSHTSIILFLFTIASALILPVNPWPRDQWFKTQYRIFGHLIGEDNYTPISVPAFFHKFIHEIASLLELDLKAEFYIGSIAQNFLVFLSSLFVLWSCQKIGLQRISNFVAILYLAFILSTGLPQAFWSENTVLFLFSAVLYLTVMIHVGEIRQPAVFWLTSVTCGMIIGALVVTRITPILIIPCLAILFYRRVDNQCFYGFISLILVTTVIFLMALSLSNLTRYGRFELTNSSGRHLWQGVIPITDHALASSPEYQALMEFNPDRRRKNFWELRIPDVEKGKFGGEELLGRLAKEAIINEPLAYIKLGIRNFVLTIGKRPYRLGFGEEQVYDPLNTDELLPPIAITILKLPTVLGDIVFKTFDYIYRGFKWIYPLVLFFVLSTYCAHFVSGVHLFLFSSDQNKETYRMRYRTQVFFIMGTPIVALVSLGVNSIAFTLVCFIILVLQSLLISKYQLDFKLIASLNGRNIGVFYTFAILLFFGTMWISWQVEIANTRNILPYLPFVFITFGMSLDFWNNRLGVSRVLTR